ncbi:RWD domain-containing protein 2B [Dendrobates tinctorius]|uniref:RWD domain-containing protein 2B n=1 Tax=Dendrobates tinctorius TaxID=92724 RepID=UPI003CC96D59
MTSYEEAEAQISELDLLSSMFPSEEEFSVTDELALAELRDYAERRVTAVTPTFQIQFTLTVKLGEADIAQHVLSLHCSYPPHYPNVPPEIVIRSPSLVRSQQAQLNSDLNAHLRSSCTGDVCILSATEWVQSNAEPYLNTAPPADNQQGVVAVSEDAIFTRLWIYSHHIYNKHKRKYILEWSKELGLSGFSMPGKPGIVCVEGAQEPCEEFWSRIRKLTWKRILIRHREDVPLSSSASGSQTEIQKLRKFPALEEKAFDVHGNRGNHMDLGQLYQFLQEKGCAEVFPMYFGIEGR